MLNYQTIVYIECIMKSHNHEPGSKKCTCMYHFRHVHIHIFLSLIYLPMVMISHVPSNRYFIPFIVQRKSAMFRLDHDTYCCGLLAKPATNPHWAMKIYETPHLCHENPWNSSMKSPCLADFPIPPEPHPGGTPWWTFSSTGGAGAGGGGLQGQVMSPPPDQAMEIIHCCWYG